MRGPVLTFCFVIVIVLFTIVWPKANRQGTVKTVTGIVTSIYAADSKDAVFKISGNKNSFYIKKDIASKYKVAELQDRLVGKTITLQYSDRWTPLDPTCNKLITSVTVGEDILFSDLQVSSEK